MDFSAPDIRSLDGGSEVLAESREPGCPDTELRPKWAQKLAGAGLIVYLPEQGYYLLAPGVEWEQVWAACPQAERYYMGWKEP